MVSGYTDRGGYLGQRVGLVDDRRDLARFDQLGQKCRRRNVKPQPKAYTNEELAGGLEPPTTRLQALRN